MTRVIHPIAGSLALFLILCFWLSTALSELLAGAATVTLVKTIIPWGFFLLVPAMMAVGMSGMRLAGKMKGHLVSAKQKRMLLVAANGLLILIPSALFLSWKAQSSQFDTVFYAVQAIELLAGGVNITLLGLNMRDGLKMTGKLGGKRAVR